MKTFLQFLMIGLLAFPVLAADGDLDGSFGTGGIVNEAFYGQVTRHKSVVVQPDGKIIAAGNALDPNFNNDYSIIRYNANGSIDTGFGVGGKVYADVGGRPDILPTLLLQPDGKFLIVGQSKDAADRSVIAIFRFEQNGTLDTSFGTNGLALSAFTTSGTRGDTANDAVLQPDGKIVVAGAWRGTAFCVGRFNGNGSVDNSFGTNGNFCATTAPIGTGLMNSVAIQGDGKIVVAGKFTTSFTSPFDFIVFRFTGGGALDTSFDGDGYAITDFNSAYDDATSVQIQPDGKILAIGRAGITGNPQYNFGAARYNQNGTLDTTFDGDGKMAAFPADTSGAENYSSVLLPSGKFVVARYRRQPSPGISTDGQFARFNPDGSVDTTFGSGGQSIVPALKEIWDLAQQPDGKIVAVGWNQNTLAITARILNSDVAPPVANPALRVADFDGDGQTDPSVYRNGLWLINPSAAPTSYSAAAFGLATDKLAPADFDGDGKTDVAVWREADQNFYILNSSDGAVRLENFGLAGDIVTAGDWDGDGKADPAVYRGGAQGTFFYRGSLNNPAGNITYLPWGTSGDEPVRGDFDGDGKLDAAVFRSADNTWYIRRSSDGQVRYDQFGLATDKRLTADFDGDGCSDLAVFRDGVWYIRSSSDGQIRVQNWGIAGDVPTAGDYDGDGKADVAVWRAGVFYVLASATSQPLYSAFGQTGDAPVAGAFIR